tara:strand:+ start:193 stop:444 length:252 start_codon:yes stop_codon:yes gene_type:complete
MRLLLNPYAFMHDVITVSLADFLAMLADIECAKPAVKPPPDDWEETLSRRASLAAMLASATQVETAPDKSEISVSPYGSQRVS